MPSTYTANAQLQKVAYDEQAEVWGGSENQNWDRVDQFICGRLEYDLTGVGPSITLTDVPGFPDQASNASYIFRGSMSSDITVEIPARAKAALSATDATTSPAFKITLHVSGSTDPNSSIVLPKGTGVFLTTGADNFIAQAGGGFIEAIKIYSTKPGQNSNVYYSVPGKTWVTYSDYVSSGGDFKLIDQTASRQVIVASASDGSVAFPVGTIKSFFGPPTSGVVGWNLGPGLVQIRKVNAPINDPFLHFVHNGSIPGGVVLAAGGGVNYVSNSDYRLKVSYGPFAAWSLPDLPVHDAAWKADPEARYPMFIAHEVAEARPWAVSGDKDAVDEDGNIKPQGVDASKLIPEMWAMIQSLRSRVNSLEGRLASCLSLR